MAQPESKARLLQHLPTRCGLQNLNLKPVQRAEDKTKTYIATHDRTNPPPNQMISTEQQNILLRQFHTRAEKKQKRAADSSDAAGGRAAKRQETRRSVEGS